MRTFTGTAAVVLLLLASNAPGGRAQESSQSDRASWPDPVDSASEAMPRAGRSLLLDLLQLPAGRLIAVGERGHVLLSDDGGGQWRQVIAPTRVNLTAVGAAGDSVVAVGHEGVILHSGDAGETWRRVREERYSLDNRFSESNGAPLLDVLFLDDQRALAIGAFNLVLHSDDGGRSWYPSPLLLDAASQEAEALEADEADLPDDEDVEEDARMSFLFSDEDLMLDDDADPHLNAIARAGNGDLVIAGERGLVYRSRDEGATWQRLALDYGGSMYGVLSPAVDHLLVFGLRGRLFESRDGGDSWSELESRVQTTLFDGAIDDDGSIVLVGEQGSLIRLSPGSPRFERHLYSTPGGETPTLAGVLPGTGGGLLLVGELGVTLWEGTP